jgi:hypothetical protein
MSNVGDPLSPATLYVIRDSLKSSKAAASPKSSQLLTENSESATFNPNSQGTEQIGFFTEVRYLNLSSMPAFFLDNGKAMEHALKKENSNASNPVDLSETVLQFNQQRDLQKLQNLNIGPSTTASTARPASSAASNASAKPNAQSKTRDIFIAVRENWNFDAVRKLPWKLHNQGLSPFFIDANRNSIWQKDWKVFKRLSEKGVILPIDLMAVARWQRNQSNWLQMSFGEGRENSLQQLSAVYLMELQVTPPYYIYESDINQWKQWVADGSVKLNSQINNTITEQD